MTQFRLVFVGVSVLLVFALFHKDTLMRSMSARAEEAQTDNMTSKRRWQPPDYLQQGPALGYNKDTFAIPERLKPRVQFWQDIYTKYTTDQGVLHDSLHVGVVYEEVDFRPIMQNTDLTAQQKAKARKDLLKERKKEIMDRLLRLHEWSKTNAHPDELKGEDRRIYDLFAAYDEPDKFKEAAKKNRLRFQLGQRDKFIEGIFYSGRYLKEMEQIFHEAGLPIELTRLPFVESSFNVKARSRVGASGVWQFMRYTGRKFLRITGSTDERNDPIKATRAAARMLRINYEMLQDWPLAVTGYNHGPAGVARMVKKYKTNDIADLVDERHGRFGFASANFYASFLAAVHVEREAEKYFGVVYWDDPVPAVEMRPTRTVNKKMLLSWFGGDLDRAKDFNPHLTRTFWSGYGALGAKDFFRVPNEVAALVEEELKNAPKREQAVAAQNEETLDGFEDYVIGPGETLSEIAAQFGLSLSRLIDLNDIQNPRRIRAGQKIKVPKK